MAMRRKNFSTYKAQGTDDVVVIDFNEGQPNQASFQCNSRIPGLVLLEFIAEMDEDDPSSLGRAVIKFLQSAINPLQWDAFMGYMRDPQNSIELDELIEVCTWLAEQYTGGNPTQPSAASSPGLPANGSGLSEQPFGQGLTSVPSTPTPSFQ